MPETPRRRAQTIARLLELSIGVAAVWALLVWVTGGLDLRPIGLPFRSRNPERAALFSLALVLVYAVAFRVRAAERARRLEVRLGPWLARPLSLPERWGGWIAAVLGLATFLVGARYGVFVAGGADSYGYVSQADLWLAGDLVVDQPFVRDMPWTDADRTFAPLGYCPSVDGRGIVPTYPPGLPVLMAGSKLALGNCGPFLVAPLLGGLAVWLTYLLGASLGSRRGGLAAATLLATSPAFLFMLLRPMSDVPATALVSAALALALGRSRGRALWAGAAISLAVFIRPNLLPLATVLLAFLAAQASSWPARLRVALRFSAGAAPLFLATALLNTHLYGAPWKSGYGSLETLYRLRYLIPNLVQYTTWLWQTETVLLACLVVPLFILRHARQDRRLAIGLAAATVACVWLSYLWYLPLEPWWTLRFLLPAFPAMWVLAVLGWRVCLGWLRAPFRALAACGLVLIVIVAHAGVVRKESLFRHWKGESDYLSAGTYVRSKLPQNAVVISMLHSGSLRLYSGRLTLRYDWLKPYQLRRALRILVRDGYRPYLLLADSEEPSYRRRFGLGNASDAPGTVLAELRQPPTARLYDPLHQPRSLPPATIPIVVPRLCCGCR